MRLPFIRVDLNQYQDQASRQYVVDNFGVVPPDPDKKLGEVAEFLHMVMAMSDVTAWAGHMASTPAGMLALARMKLGFGAPQKGLQWLGMRVFVDSCYVLIDRGFPPAAVDLGQVEPMGMEDMGAVAA